MVPSRFVVPLVAGASLLACHGYAEPSPVGPVEVTSSDVAPPAPAEALEACPYVIYEGHPTYLYGGRWYYRDRDRWRAYRTAPHARQQHPRERE